MGMFGFGQRRPKLDEYETYSSNPAPVAVAGPREAEDGAPPSSRPQSFIESMVKSQVSMDMRIVELKVQMARSERAAKLRGKHHRLSKIVKVQRRRLLKPFTWRNVEDSKSHVTEYLSAASSGAD